MNRSDPVERGLRFLLACRSGDGWWRDFQTLAGPSDEWVTAYVAWALAKIPGGEAVAAEALELLEPRLRDGGFGYAARVPPDCDTTAWICRLAEVRGRTDSPAYHSGIEFLRGSIRGDGGVPTYPADSAIRMFTKVPEPISFTGWTSSHVCVSANAAGLAGLAAERRLRVFVRQSRRADGSWRGYWWQSSAYPTMLAALALGVDDQARVWATASNSKSAFELACLLTLGAPVREQLIDCQLADGSWPASAALRVPAPFVTEPDSVHSRISMDQNRTYTTATAVRALHEAC